MIKSWHQGWGEVSFASNLSSDKENSSGHSKFANILTTKENLLGKSIFRPTRINSLKFCTIFSLIQIWCVVLMKPRVLFELIKNINGTDNN